MVVSCQLMMTLAIGSRIALGVWLALRFACTEPLMSPRYQLSDNNADSEFLLFHLRTPLLTATSVEVEAFHVAHRNASSEAASGSTCFSIDFIYGTPPDSACPALWRA